MTFNISLKNALAAICVAGASFCLGAIQVAADDAVHTSVFSNVAVSGYDAVAYFTEGKPVKGSKTFTTNHNGATWRFSNQANLDMFSADPATYTPQYGGYCAWAVSQGYTAAANPKNWAIEDGKLYLNYNADVQAAWNKDRAGFIEDANANWPEVLK